jgi:hypothetical protein
MWGLASLNLSAAARTTKGLNDKDIDFFHLRHVINFDELDTLSLSVIDQLW